MRKATDAVLILAMLAAGYLGVAMFVYAVRHPELTQMQVLLDIGRAVMREGGGR